MELIENLFMGYPNLWGGGVAHSVLILSLVITIGIALGKIKVAGVSLGITWILFVGIVFGHFNMNLDEHLLHFLKEFGLILFVYSIGLQVGPGFFSAFKKGGLTLNMVAMTVVFSGVILAIVLHFISGVPITTMVGILSGAVTNTPGLGAAQQANSDLNGVDAPEIALGYAVAYPLGVIGCIMSLWALKYILRIKVDTEEADAKRGSGHLQELTVRPVTIEIHNESVIGKKLRDIHPLVKRYFVVSHIYHADTGLVEMADADTVLNLNDKILLTSAPVDIDAITVFLGCQAEMDWEQEETDLVTRSVVITRSEVNGKMLSQLKIRNSFGANVIRVNRSGVDLVASPNLQLQIGDRVVIVGTELAVGQTEKVLGNSLKQLNHPNLIPIFLGIALGCILGSVPFVFPGIPQPVKLGLAGGPIITGILMGAFGPRLHLSIYTTRSANLMLRQLGLIIYLAGLGLSAGKDFFETVFRTEGLVWIGVSFLLAVVPVLIVGWIATRWAGVDYAGNVGMLCGSMANPIALDYANTTVDGDEPSVAYATVYPFSIFLRVISIQIILLVFS